MSGIAQLFIGQAEGERTFSKTCSIRLDVAVGKNVLDFDIFSAGRGRQIRFAPLNCLGRLRITAMDLTAFLQHGSARKGKISDLNASGAEIRQIGMKFDDSPTILNSRAIETLVTEDDQNFASKPRQPSGSGPLDGTSLTTLG